jgi:hypothetical protein
MPTVLNAAFNDVERMIYCRKRIIDTLYAQDPEKYGELSSPDILSISLQGDQVQCEMGDHILLIDKGLLIQNFWEHRTRTPSFFEYKIWKEYITSQYKNGVPVGAIDYNKPGVAGVLDAQVTKGPRLAVDKDGVQKLYFVSKEEQSCTCKSWDQLNQHRELFEKEFKAHSDTEFVPMCKHLRWLNASIRLNSFSFLAKVKNGKYNPNICVYQYDHSLRLLKYKTTRDGVKANAQWLPVGYWKEKMVYDAGGMPTGECWSTFEAALSSDEPYKLVPYSNRLNSFLSRSGSR